MSVFKVIRYLNVTQKYYEKCLQSSFSNKFEETIKKSQSALQDLAFQAIAIQEDILLIRAPDKKSSWDTV